jgi:hypothetical protein
MRQTRPTRVRLHDFVSCSHRFVISRRSCGDLMCFTTVGETACR